MALHILNLSVDTKDAQSDAVPEDLSINDQESFVELVLEDVMGIDNAVSESDEPDSEDGGVLDFQKMTMFYIPVHSITCLNFSFSIQHCLPEILDQKMSIVIESDSPPPKV